MNNSTHGADMEVFIGKRIHKPSGQDADVHLTVCSRQEGDGVCRIVWEAHLTLPDGSQRPVERRLTVAPAQYQDAQIDDLAGWLLVGDLGE